MASDQVLAGMNPKDVAALDRVPLQLLPGITSVIGAMACRQGAIDYDPYNWREKPISLMEYIGAIERHILRIKEGGWVDHKSAAPHLGHIVATAGIIEDARLCGTLIDDRPATPGKAGDILDYFEKDMKSGGGQAQGTGEQGRKIGGGANARNTPIPTSSSQDRQLLQRRGEDPRCQAGHTMVQEDRQHTQPTRAHQGEDAPGAGDDAEGQGGMNEEICDECGEARSHEGASDDGLQLCSATR